ncbi:MAG: hypothetical protein PHW10_04945 [Candidatus Peribacteraceae bacterium]|nr:hypothetical protein [Candidatus Peribacteraceae bacterium]
MNQQEIDALVAQDPRFLQAKQVLESNGRPTEGDASLERTREALRWDVQRRAMQVTEGR